ncbi:MAG: LacI family transcriptional regulator [Deltaproteobacteria bacterium]|jgi:DNA-binding LacI/PurR family transcriptional regulator|nr:LacI family transcriptional regulator [Deltaproteobacteria bacterium]
MPKLTISDIAKLANVSTATVSRVIQNSKLVRPDTKNRVLSTIDKYGYVYNALAGNLSKRKSSVLGVFVPTVESAKLSETIFSLQEMVQSFGHPIIVNNTSFNPSLERAQLRMAREHSLSGVFFIGYMTENIPYIDELIQEGIPAIFLWDILPDTSYNFVGFDNERATYMMTEYLISLGHRRIAFVGAMQSQVERVSKRLNGYISCMRDHKIPTTGDLIMEAKPTLANGRLLMERYLDSFKGRKLPTAVFFASDMLALGAITACRDRGLDVPGDISIAGFDNIEYASYIFPPLTTVYVPSREMGQVAGEFLMDLLEGGAGKPHQRCLETRLLVRGTCGPPPRHRQPS